MTGITIGTLNGKTRFKMNPFQTVRYFDRTVFNQNEIFRSASQLCEQYFVPDMTGIALGIVGAPTADDVHEWWSTDNLSRFKAASDNGREEPYNHVYSRITTKSNTYTVHWRVQSLRRVPGASRPTDEWNEDIDQVIAESRGSTLIERYIDPNARDIIDYATKDIVEIAERPLSAYYKWRIVANTKFNP